MWGFRSRLLAFIISIVQDAHTAEDVLQDVAVAAVRKHQEIRDAATGTEG